MIIDLEGVIYPKNVENLLDSITDEPFLSDVVKCVKKSNVLCNGRRYWPLNSITRYRFGS